MFGIIAVCLLITIDRKRPNEYGLGVYVSIYYNKRNFWRFCECDFDFVFGSSKNCSSRWESLRIRYVLLWKRRKKQRHKHRKSHRNDIIALWVTNTHSLRIHSNITAMNVARASVFSFISLRCIYVYIVHRSRVSLFFMFIFFVRKFAWLSYSNALSIKITHISRCVW